MLVVQQHTATGCRSFIAKAVFWTYWAKIEASQLDGFGWIWNKMQHRVVLPFLDVLQPWILIEESWNLISYFIFPPAYHILKGSTRGFSPKNACRMHCFPALSPGQPSGKYPSFSNSVTISRSWAATNGSCRSQSSIFHAALRCDQMVVTACL